jgi:hypothetical protein
MDHLSAPVLALAQGLLLLLLLLLLPLLLLLLPLRPFAQLLMLLLLLLLSDDLCHCLRTSVCGENCNRPLAPLWHPLLPAAPPTDGQPSS